MSFTCWASCCPNIRNGHIRGTDETLKETQGTGAASTAQSAIAGCRVTASGSCTSGACIAAVSDTLGEAASEGRTEGATSGLRVPEAETAVGTAMQRTGAAAEGWAADRRCCDGAVGVAAHLSVDREEVLGLDDGALIVAAARAARLECAAAGRPGSRMRRTADVQFDSQELARARKIAARQGRVIVFIDNSGLPE